MKIENLSKTLNWIMVIAFALIIALGPVFNVFENREVLNSFIYGLILALGINYILPFVKFKKQNALNYCIILSALCFLVKFLWIYIVRIEPLVDYETYFNYAKTLSESFFAPDRYVALFPHIFGYSYFLSFFMKIFGTGELLVPIINVIFSVISGILIFKIACRLIDIKAGVFSYVLWIFCPSQTIYNSLVLSDLFYTTLVLAFVIIITELDFSKKIKMTALLGVLSGLILRLVNITRPIAAILVIAVFIWLFVLRTKEWTSSDFRKKWSPFLIMLVLCYFITGPLWDGYVTKRLGEKPASVPGYNIMVGFNMNSLGTWNLEDSTLLTNYSNSSGATAVWAQEQMLKEAKEHITSGNINFLKLFKNKLITFSGSDSSAVYYHRDVLADSRKPLEDLCNTFYYMVIILSLFSIPCLGRYSRKTTMSVVLLYIFGLTLAQMLVEVAGRYHYSIIPMLILVCQYGLFFKNKE